MTKGRARDKHNKGMPVTNAIGLKVDDDIRDRIQKFMESQKIEPSVNSASAYLVERGLEVEGF